MGTGGHGLDTPGAEAGNSQVLNASTHGIIKMTLHGSLRLAVRAGREHLHRLGHGDLPWRRGRARHAAPVTTVGVQRRACGAGWYNNTVQATLLPTDNAGGSGVDKTYYTTDGTTPTTASTVYTAPFTVAAVRRRLKYFSVDKTGNAERSSPN